MNLRKAELDLSYAISKALTRLSQFLETRFAQAQGNARDYHENPKGKQYIYQTLKIGISLDEIDTDEAALILCESAKRVFAWMSMQGGKLILWRNGERVQIERDHFCESGAQGHSGDILALRSRFAVVNAMDEQVMIPDWFRVEEESINWKILTIEEIEDDTWGFPEGEQPLNMEEILGRPVNGSDRQSQYAKERAEATTQEKGRDSAAPIAALGSMIRPGKVLVHCGCSPEGHCPQGRVGADRRCAIWMDEMDLIRITNDVILARFMETRTREEKADERR